MEATIECTVNGERIERRIAVRMNLVDFLRQDCGLTGSHTGCEHGVCGACTVLVDGRSVRGCLMLAVQANGAVIETVEGLHECGRIADLQDAFLRHNALQCGYCTSGMLASASEFLDAGVIASRDDIRSAISGNYCRCTGYQAIVDAVAEVMVARGGKVTS
ncbi:MAG: (2Fe-2S)-binding protein [Hyphomicrobiales bacterium]|nr:(2Fe-2S)-binding protein [Hyphomicrobiales bacterium]